MATAEARLISRPSAGVTREIRATRSSSGTFSRTVSPTGSRSTPGSHPRAARNGCFRNGCAAAYPKWQERRLTRIAMDQISAETAHLMALRAGEGLNVPQDWQAAFDLLRRSAELGFPLAQSSLAALAGEWALAKDIADGALNLPVDWNRLRDSIELTNWLTSPRPRIVSASPRIAVVEEFASPQICDWLIARARPKLAPAKVYDLVTGGPTNESVRTNSECHFPASEGDLVLQLLRRRIADVTETSI